jgi:hypothetical protein
MNEEHSDMRRRLTPISMAASTVCIGLGAASAAGSDVPAGDGSANSGNGIDVQVPDSKERVEQYWTPDRMRAAKPVPKPLVKRPEVSPAAEDGDVTETE